MDTNQEKSKKASRLVGMLIVFAIVTVCVWRVSLVYVPMAKPVWVFEGSGDLMDLVELQNGSILATSMPPDLSGSVKPKLFCVNPDGSEKWHFDASDTLFCDPVEGADGTVFIGDFSGSFYAINPDGSIRWTCNTGSIGNLKPAVSKAGTVFAYNHDQELIAISPVGTVSQLFVAGRSRLSKIIIGKQGTVYLSPGDGNLYALGQDGTLMWFEHFGDRVSIAQDYAGGRIYAAGGQWMFAYGENEIELWRQRFRDLDINSVVNLPNGRIALTATDNARPINAVKNYLLVLDKDGNELWRKKFEKWIAHSVSADDEGNIYLALRTKDLAEEIKKQFTWFSKQGNAELMVLGPEGRKRWHRRFGIGLVGSPVITSEGLVVFAGLKDKHLYAFQPNLR